MTTEPQPPEPDVDLWAALGRAISEAKADRRAAAMHGDIEQPDRQMCTCERDPGVAFDRWGDPICRPCLDRMAAYGRTP